MQVGGALAKVIVLGELPSAAGHGVSPVTVAPAIVLGSGVNVVVGALGSIVVVEPNASIVVVELPGVAGRGAVVAAIHQPDDPGDADRRPGG